MRYNLALLCFVVALYLGYHAGETEGEILKHVNLTLAETSSDVAVYQQFIVVQLRRSVPQRPAGVHNLTVLNETTQGKKFFYIGLSNRGDEQATLAMDVANLYILGYAVFSRNVSFFFKDVASDTQKSLFDGTKKTNLSYGGNYATLGDRSNVNIGIPPLRDAIKDLLNRNRQPASKSFIVILQVISEAIRYRYIERLIAKRSIPIPNFKPNDKVLSLENNWGKLSKQILLAVKNNITKFQNPVQLKDENGTPFNVTNLDSPVVREDISILLNS